ncbi:unnamed protein product, partial [Cladocopium goreaui]
EPVLPEMPFAPPEGDYGDDSETTEHLEQFRHEQGRDTLVSASGSSGSSYQVRKPCVWIHGIPFEAKTEDFDTGWEYLYDGLVCPEDPVGEISLLAPLPHPARTAPVWHPIEELSACFRIAVNCTDKSLSIRERLASPPVVQFRAEASEGFQGLKGDRAVSHWTYPENAKKEPGKYLAHVDLVVKNGDARFLGISSLLFNFCLSHSWHSGLLSSWIAKRDLFPVAFTEKESDADKNRRDSWVTKVPEEGDDLEEFEESDECQWFDDGVGGVAQVATPQMFDISNDLDGESEAAKPQMFDISSDLDGESEEPVLPEMPFAPPEGDYGDDSETTEHLEQFGHEQELVLPEMPFAPPEADYGDDSETTEHLEQFGHEQGRDTLVSASGSSGSSYQ